MATVNITAKIKGNTDFIARARDFFEHGITDFLEEVAKEAATKVDTEYSKQGAGNTDYSVEGKSTGTLSAVTEATGSDIFFLEYGAGDLTSAEDPFGGKGSWSKSPKGSGTYARHGHWHYYNVDYTGIKPTRGIYHGARHAEDYIRKHGTEAFEK